MTPGGVAVALASLVAATTLVVRAQQEPPPVFRSIVNSVEVDVSVRERGRPALNLAARDFELRDNGVVQTILDVSQEALPIEATLVVDLSGSVQGALLTQLVRAVQEVQRQLRPTDRARLVTFNQRVRETVADDTHRAISAITEVVPQGQTSLFDALVLSFIAPPSPSYRQMALVFTDGQDTMSFLEAPAVLDVARRSNLAVFTIAVSDGMMRTPFAAAHESLFKELAEETGGFLVVLQRDQELSGAFVRAMEQFRTSYVLRYQATGVKRDGWHDLGVRVTRAGAYDVRARRGYFGTR
jgi:VWFA-related protein